MRGNIKGVMILIISIIALPYLAWGATYYVCDTGSTCGAGWSTGSDTNSSAQAQSKSTPWKTIKTSIGKISGGDTLIIGNGTYQGSNNMLANSGGEYSISAKGGTQAKPTTIKAENDFGVVIDGQTTNITGWTTGGSWMIVRGLHFRNSATYGWRVMSADHFKIIRCAFQDMGSFGLSLSNTSTNNLVEQCFAFGYSNYYFNDSNYWGANDKNIWRTNFVRRDGHNTDYDNHYGSFTTYFSPTNNSYWQNSVTVDSVKRPAESNSDIYCSAPFYGANGTKGAIIDQMVAINEHGYAVELESAGTATIKNSIFYMGASDWKDGILSYASNTYENLIINGASNNYKNGFWQVSGSVGSFKNNIVYNNVTGLISTTNSYCNLFSNTTNYSGSSAGTGNVTYNPQTNGLLYPVRIEAGSALATAGSGGGRLGPEILYKVGRTATDTTQCGGTIDGMSCALYGDTGWNELQDGQSGRALAKLWPFPNEDTIKTKLAAYNANGVSGARGFCTGTSKDGTPQTLTKYIWEYLGNQIPSDIYNTEAIQTPRGLRIIGSTN